MKSYWMWHWGDYEIYHTYVENTRRQEFGADYPTMWHGDVPYPTVSFTRSFTAETPGTMKVAVSGKGYFTLDGKRYPTGVAVPVAPGRHSALVYEMSAKSTAIPFPWQSLDISWQIGGYISTCFIIGTRRPIVIILRETKLPTPLRERTSPSCLSTSIDFTAVRWETPNRRHIIFTDGKAEPGAYLPDSMSSLSLSATSRYLAAPAKPTASQSMPLPPTAAIIAKLRARDKRRIF